MIELKKYRNKRRQDYMAKYGKLIEAEVENFLCRQVRTSYKTILKKHLASCQSEQAWDYLELREIIMGALRDTFAAAMIKKLSKFQWFDSRFCSEDEITELALSQLVLGDRRSQSSGS